MGEYSQQQHELNMVSDALDAASVGIANAIEEQAITGQQVYSLLQVINKQLKEIKLD